MIHVVLDNLNRFFSLAQFPSIFSMLMCFSVNFRDRNSVQQLKTVLITEPQDRLFSWTQFSCSVVSDSATPWTAARQTSLSITSSRSLPKLMSIESVMPSNHLILCCPLLLLPSIFPSIRVFSNESALHFAGLESCIMQVWKCSSAEFCTALRHTKTIVHAPEKLRI